MGAFNKASRHQTLTPEVFVLLTPNKDTLAAPALKSPGCRFSLKIQEYVKRAQCYTTQTSKIDHFLTISPADILSSHRRHLFDEHPFSSTPEIPGFVDMVESEHLVTVLDQVDNDVFVVEVSWFGVHGSRDKRKLDLL